jgi:putative tricarboxylic transport membrane protein
VGYITGLALLLLFWPLISRVIAKVRPPKPASFAAEQPVD